MLIVRAKRSASPQMIIRQFFVVLVLNCSCSCLLSSCAPPKPSYEGYGYLIVAPESVLASVGDFADYKESKGLLVDVISLEGILSTSPGDDDPEKIRNHPVHRTRTTFRLINDTSLCVLISGTNSDLRPGTLEPGLNQRVGVKVRIIHEDGLR